MHNRSYYEAWLLELEARELDIVGLILAIDMQLYETQKVVHQLRELNEEEDFLLGTLLFNQIRLKNMIDRYRAELTEIALDISHCRFMISRTNL